MNRLLMLSCLVASALAFPGGDHHGDGHEENCVDISKYSDILYEISTHDICTFRTRSQCSEASSEACVAVPVQKCQISAYPSCTTEPFTMAVRDDLGVGSETSYFTPKECFENGQQTLIENHKKPVCQNVTKQQCDSKWVINAAGEKVWAGNENCQERTWEECQLVDVPTEITVPTYTCRDGTPIPYSVPNTAVTTTTVTGYRTVCEPAAYPICETTTVNACSSTMVSQCSDVIEPVCFGQAFFKVPYQTYDHRLKCIVAH